MKISILSHLLNESSILPECSPRKGTKKASLIPWFLFIIISSIICGRYAVWPLLQIASVISSTTTSSTTAATPIIKSSSSSAATSSWYNDCMASFTNRSHPLNDGVSLRIGVFTMWNKAELRQTIRETVGQWIPQNTNFQQYCLKQQQIKYQQLKQQQQTRGTTTVIESFATNFSPNPSSHPLTTLPYSNLCRDGATAFLDMSWWSVYDNIDMVFVIGASGSPNRVRELMIEREQQLFGDLMILEQVENMDHGKSLTYFKAVATDHLTLLNHSNYVDIHSTAEYPLDYAMKLDDDSFLHIPHYVRTLRNFRVQRLPEVYYGLYFNYPHTLPPLLPASNLTYYHSGMGYLMSLDLITWFLTEEARDIIANTMGPTTPNPNPQGAGFEDMNFGLWLSARGRLLKRDINLTWQGGSGHIDDAYKLYHALVANFFNAGSKMYYYPDWRRYWALTQFDPNTEIIHYNKNDEWYNIIIQHFMCNQTTTFQWERPWWTTRDIADISFFFDDSTGATIPQNTWYNDWGAIYKETHLQHQRRSQTS